MFDIFLAFPCQRPDCRTSCCRRVLPDGTCNQDVLLQRFKDQLNNHATASSEFEYDGVTAWLVSEKGRGGLDDIPSRWSTASGLDPTLGSATTCVPV